MNMFRKLVSGEWAIATNGPAQEGDVVTVSLASGSTKQVKLGAWVGEKIGVEKYFLVAPADVKPMQEVGSFQPMIALFNKAKTHLKYPAVTLRLKDGGSIRINVAGDMARFPGSLTVTSEKDPTTGERKWFGRVHKDGKYEASQNAPASVADLLKQFAADPAAVATAHGKLTGHCCFCNIKLKDERSTGVGYGQICAEHFGLPWGVRPTEFAGAA